MKKSLPVVLLVILVIVVLPALLLLGSYNRLVQLDEAVQSAWGQVENVYQRRADLIPNLVETVKGARDFEQETLTQVVEARARATGVSFRQAPSAEQMAQFEAAQGELSSALSRLLVVVENYPELKATQNFRDLQVQLEGTENRIAVERKRYNDAVRELNTARRQFPAVFVARLFNIGEKAYFKAEEGAERPPQVQF